MPQHGMDVPALRGFARSLDEQAAAMHDTLGALTRLVEGLNWVGPDRERFVEEWSSIHRPRLLETLEDVVHTAVRARHHADEQEWASS